MSRAEGGKGRDATESRGPFSYNAVNGIAGATSKGPPLSVECVQQRDDGDATAWLFRDITTRPRD